MPWVLGVDAGGNKTVAKVANEKGRILGRGEAGPANYHTVGLARAVEAIRAATQAAIAEAGLLPQALAACCFAIAGLDRPVDRQVMASALAGLELGGKLLLEHNAFATLVGATGNRPGVVIIAGTGSVACGEDEEGRRVRVGGYGPVLGDEGSAYDIGRRALVAALRHEDGRGPATALTARIKERFLLDSMLDLTHLVHGDPPALGRHEISLLAPLVIATAQEGDAVAREILKAAGRELGLAGAAVLRQLRFTGREVPVAAAGDIFAAGHLLTLPMVQALRQACPGAVLIAPRHTTAYGACLLALRGLGIHLDGGADGGGAGTVPAAPGRPGVPGTPPGPGGTLGV